MKEKKILVAVLLSMAAQVQAVRSPLQGQSSSVDVVEKAPAKKDKEKTHKREKAKKEEKQSTAPDKRKMKKENLSAKEDHRKEAKQKEEREKKKTVQQRIEKKKEEKHPKEKIVEKKRAELEKSIRKLENGLKSLEDKKAAALDEEEEQRAENGRHGKEYEKRHVINHGSVKLETLNKEIKDHKEMLARKEEALAALSKDVRNEKRDEHYNRVALSKIYENNQKDLRAELTKVQDAIKALYVEEVKAKNEIQDDKAGYEDHLRSLRDAETRHDFVEAEAHRKALFAKDSDEMKALQAREKRVREELEVLRKKMGQNEKASQSAAKEGGVRLESRQERHEKEIDRMIKEDKKPRVFTETAREVQDRKEELAHEEMVKKEKRMKRRPTMGEDDVVRRDSKKAVSTEKKTLKKKKMDSSVNEVAHDFNMMEEEDHA